MSEQPAPAQATLPGLSGMAERAKRPLIRAPLPQAASARGRLVATFPPFLAPTAGSDVQTSSVSPLGTRLQVALVSTTPQAVSAVVRAYRARLVARGMAERPLPSLTAATTTAAFDRGQSSVTLTVSREGARTTYSVFGVLHTGGD
jgi:hypothetical protein